MDDKLNKRIHEILNEYYTGSSLEQTHLPKGYCISEISDKDGKLHQLLYSITQNRTFYDITDTDFYTTFVHSKLSMEDISRIKADRSIPSYSKQNEDDFISTFGNDVAEKMKHDQKSNTRMFGDEAKAIANKIREKFGVDKTEDIIITPLDDGNIKLKIGDRETVGSKLHFYQFVNQPSVKTFGDISFTMSPTQKRDTIIRNQKERIRVKFNISPEQDIIITPLDDGNIKLKIGDRETVGSKQKFSQFVSLGSTQQTFGDISFSNKPQDYVEKIRKKLKLDPTQEISITNTEDGNVKLKIGDKELVGSKKQFTSFVNQPEVKSFGGVYFGKRDVIKKSTQKEINIANAVDDWIKKDVQNPSNPNIDDVLDGDNKTDHFYAVHAGGSTKSDVLVVHDKRKFNPDSKTPKSPDKDFYIEAKLSEKSRSFNPSLNIIGNKREFRFKYNGFFVDKNDKKIKQVKKNISEEEEAQEQSKNIILGDKITELVEQTPESKRIIATLKEMLNTYKGPDVSTNGEYEFPVDFDVFPDIFDAKLDQAIQTNDTKYLDFMLNTFNKKYKAKKKSVEELKGISGNQKTTMLVYRAVNEITGKTTLDMFAGEIPSQKIKAFGDLVTWWYRTKKNTAYIEIGPDGKNPGGIYLFDMDFDPFNLQEKFPGKIKTYTECIRGASYVIRRLHNENANGFVVNFKLKVEGNGLQFEDILDTNKGDALKMEPGDTKNDDSEFFNPKS